MGQIADASKMFTVGVPPGTGLENTALRVRSPKITLSCRTLIFWRLFQLFFRPYCEIGSKTLKFLKRPWLCEINSTGISCFLKRHDHAIWWTDQFIRWKSIIILFFGGWSFIEYQTLFLISHDVCSHFDMFLIQSYRIVSREDDRFPLRRFCNTFSSWSH